MPISRTCHNNALSRRMFYLAYAVPNASRRRILEYDYWGILRDHLYNTCFFTFHIIGRLAYYISKILAWHYIIAAYRHHASKHHNAALREVGFLLSTLLRKGFLAGRICAASYAYEHFYLPILSNTRYIHFITQRFACESRLSVARFLRSLRVLSHSHGSIFWYLRRARWLLIEPTRCSIYSFDTTDFITDIDIDIDYY